MKTYYISPVGEGNGTKSKPFNGSNFDLAIDTIKRIHLTSPQTPVKIIILPGEYWTRGFAPLHNWWVQAHGATLILKDVGNQGFHSPDNYVVATAYYGKSDGPVWLDSFRWYGGTIDVNWQGQSDRQTPSRKFGGIYSQSVETAIKDIRIINWGSNGLNVAQSEVFPLFAVTLRREDAKILIERCTVEKQHQYQGGYATAINVVTVQDQWNPGGDVIPWATSRPTCAVVRNCVVRGIHGHGLGAAWADAVIFKGNTIEKSKTGFNGDTGNLRDITFDGNRFLACNQGLFIGNASSGQFSRISVKGNIFHLTEPWTNHFLVPKRVEFSYGVRLSGLGVSEVSFENNLFMAWPQLTRLMGRYGVGFCEGAEVINLSSTDKFAGIPDSLVSDVPFYMEDNE